MTSDAVVPVWPIGVCRVAWDLDPRAAAVAAQAMGFSHLDLLARDGCVDLVLPKGAVIGGRFGRGWAWLAPPAGADWDAEMSRLRSHPCPRVEPWAGSMLGSDDAIRRAVEEVPGLRLVVDTGHVACWGGNPLGLLQFADHIQLRDADVGRGQLAPGRGVVDFEAVLRRLDDIDYRGLLTVEYFDFAGTAWEFPDPVQACAEMLELVRETMTKLTMTAGAAGKRIEKAHSASATATACASPAFSSGSVMARISASEGCVALSD